MAVTSVGGGALASSHREAPGIAKDPTADITDLYAFVSPDKTDTITKCTLGGRLVLMRRRILGAAITAAMILSTLVISPAAAAEARVGLGTASAFRP
jgi:hypothetical protein